MRHTIEWKSRNELRLMIYLEGPGFKANILTPEHIIEAYEVFCTDRI